MGSEMFSQKRSGIAGRNRTRQVHQLALESWALHNGVVEESTAAVAFRFKLSCEPAQETERERESLGMPWQMVVRKRRAGPLERELEGAQKKEQRPPVPMTFGAKIEARVIPSKALQSCEHMRPKSGKASKSSDVGLKNWNPACLSRERRTPPSAE